MALMISALLPNSASSTEPDGFFGLKFGEPVPQEALLTPGMPAYKEAFDMVSDEARSLLTTDLFDLAFPATVVQSGEPEGKDAGKMLEKIRKALPAYKSGLLVSPPVPNRAFDAYVAMVAPETRALVAIWAYGEKSEDARSCKLSVTALAKHLMSKYPRLRPMSLLPNFPATLAESVFLDSERSSIWITCGYFEARDREQEKQWEEALRKMMERGGSRALNFDDSGL